MWLSDDQATEIVAQYGTSLFVYSKGQLRTRARELMQLTQPYGITVRYAIKANPHPEIIKLLVDMGLHFDASSSYEASLLISQGVPGDRISLSSQQSAHNLEELLSAGVQYVATSMHQLELFVNAAYRGNAVALRVNPAIDSAGQNNRLSTSGIASSFGLWHEYVDKALEYASSNQVVINRLHMHIGTGADPAVWASAMDMALGIVRRMPDVTVLDIGGGYKIAYAIGEHETEMKQISAVFAEKLQLFAQETSRELRLEIEPGRWLVAHAGVLLSQVDDIVDTGAGGYAFLRLNTGMNDFIRAAMYGAQHGLRVVNNTLEETEYIVTGHCCETSDMLTTMPGDPEHISPRKLHKAEIGDIVVIADAGAYCASFSTKQYNAFPSALEVFVD